MGAMIGGSLLSSIAGAFIGSSIAHAMFDDGAVGGGPDVVNNYYGDAPGETSGPDAPDEASDAVGFEDPVGDFGGDDLGGFEV